MKIMIVKIFIKIIFYFFNSITNIQEKIKNLFMLKKEIKNRLIEIHLIK